MADQIMHTAYRINFTTAISNFFHVFALVTVLALLATPVAASPGDNRDLVERIREDIEISTQEQAWLESHPRIRIGLDTNYAPYSFLENGDTPAGVAPDFITIIKNSLGIDFIPITNRSWSEIIAGITANDIDVVATVVQTPHREPLFNFSQVYLPTPLVITARERQVEAVNAIEKLSGKTVAVVRQYSTTERLLSDNPAILPFFVNSTLEGLEAVATGEVDAFVGVLGTIAFQAQQNGLTNLVIAGRYDLEYNGQRFAVRKDWPELAGLIDKVLNLISQQEKNALLERWVPLTLNGAAIHDTNSSMQWRPEERRWLNEHPSITVGINNAWAPMDFVDDEGIPRGIGTEFIKALNKRLEGRLQVVPGDWEAIYERVRDKRIDALMDITPRKDREADFLFTNPYIKIPHVFITQPNRPYISNLNDLNGRSLAVEKGFFLAELLEKRYPEIKIHTYENTNEALNAVSDGSTYAYAGNRVVATHIIRTEVISNLETHGKVNESASTNAIGVRKDAPMLRQILQKALEDMSLRERLQILEAWTLNKNVVSPGEFNLTDEEWSWLNQHPIIRVANDPDFPPIEFTDAQGHAAGIAMEYLDILSDSLGLRFDQSVNTSWQEVVEKLKARELDMYAAAAPTPQRQEYANFTTPYLNIPVMIFAKDDAPRISSMADFAGKKVAIVQGYAVADMINNDNWGMQIVLVPNILSALRAVQSGEADAFIGNVLSASYFIRQNYLTDIIIAGHTPYRLDLAMGVRNDWPHFVSILNKVLAKISEPERAHISSRWIGIQIQEPADYSLFWKILIAGLLLVVLVVFWNAYLRRKIAQHTQLIRGQNQILEQRQAELGIAQRIARLGSWNWNIDTGKFSASDILLDIIGVTDNKQLSSFDDYLSYVDTADQQTVRSTILKSMQNASTFELDYGLVCADNRHIYVHEQGEVYSEDGTVKRISSAIQDVTARRDAESTIYKLQQAFNKSPSAIVICDLQSRIEYVNDAFTRTTGYNSSEVIGANSVDLLTPPNLLDEYQQILDRVKSGEVWHGELLSNNKGGDPFWEDVTLAPIIDNDGNVVNLLELRQDISHHKATEEQLFNEVNFCPLTRLPNQAYLLRELHHAEDSNQHFTLFFVDLLNLKRINDNLGFEAGDALIIQVARRLDQSTIKPDMIAHLGGGQYLIKLNSTYITAIEHQIDRIFDNFRRPYLVDNEQISQHICVGVVRSPEDGTDPNELLSRVYIAANQAKKSSTAQWSFFSREHSQQTQNKFHMENLLAQALDKNELSIVYQPKIDIRSGQATGVEALLRWHNEELGPVPPNQFIPVAEQNDLILNIGRWVIQESIIQANIWRDEGLAELNLAINLSPKQFLDTNLASFIQQCLQENGIEGHRLELELTESLLMENSDDVSRQMETLKTLGIHMILDDFGTGFSSLSYLQKFPFDGLKIDRSFIFDYPRYQGNVGLIKTIIAMGNALNMTLVAEGVETQDQADFLIREGCNIFQGYLYGKPMTNRDFVHWLSKNTDLVSA